MPRYFLICLLVKVAYKAWLLGKLWGMRRISDDEALKIAYERLYESDLNKIDKNLDALLKAKKFVSRKNRKK